MCFSSIVFVLHLFKLPFLVLLGRIFDQLTFIVNAGPFGFAIVDIDNPSRVEHVATINRYVSQGSLVR